MCLVIMAMDCYILQNTLQRSHHLASLYPPFQFSKCAGPQFNVRILFISYAILASFTAFLFTMVVIVIDEFSAAFERAINAITTLMYVCFGPALLTFCVMGLRNITPLQRLCSLDGELSDRVNTVDPAMLCCATVLSVIVLWCFSLQVTISTASEGLNDEQSPFFQSFISHLNERKRSYALNKQSLKEKRDRWNGNYGDFDEEQNLLAEHLTEISMSD